MEAKEFYNKRITEDPTIGTVQLMEEYLEYISKKLSTEQDNYYDLGYRLSSLVDEYLNKGLNIYDIRDAVDELDAHIKHRIYGF